MSASDHQNVHNAAFDLDAAIEHIAHWLPSQALISHPNF